MNGTCLLKCNLKLKIKQIFKYNVKVPHRKGLYGGYHVNNEYNNFFKFNLLFYFYIVLKMPTKYKVSILNTIGEKCGFII